MKRRSARQRKAAPPVPPDAFEHSSGHDDLAAVIDDHLIDQDAAESTAGWLPSRRGNSPRPPADKVVDDES